MSTEKVQIEKLSPLCVRIKNAFTMDEIRLIRKTYNYGIQPMVDITPHCRLKVSFDHHYIDCETLGSVTIYNDEKERKEKEEVKDKEELVQIKICESEYAIRNGISNVICFIPLTRIDPYDLRQNHCKILCRTVWFLFICTMYPKYIYIYIYIIIVCM